MKLKKLRALYEAIDVNNEGKITEESLLNAKLPMKTIALLRPLIKDGKTLDFGTFIDKLSSVLNVSM